MQLTTANITMSSLDLLDMVNSARMSASESAVRHSDFFARCLDELHGEHYEISVVQNSNKTTTSVIHMDADQCKLVAMRESKSVRRAVLDRLKELESGKQNSFKIPTTLSGALRLAADQADQIEKQQALIEQQKPAVQFVESYVQSEGLLGFRQVAKLLQANERKFRQMLLDQGVMYYLAGALTPMAAHINAGRFEVKTGTGDNDHAYTQAKFTPRGVQWVAGLWAAHKMEHGE